MSYGTILNRVRYNVTGSAAMQAADLAILRDLVREGHKELQRTHDLWFNNATIDLTLTANQRDYDLDTSLPRLKRITDAWILRNGAPYWRLEPLTAGALADGGRIYERSGNSMPLHYHTVDGPLSFIPTPSTDEVVRFYVKQYLPELPTDPTEFDAYNDAFSIHGETVLIYHASIVALGGRDNQTRAQFFNSLYDSALLALTKESRYKRDRGTEQNTIRPRW